MAQVVVYEGEKVRWSGVMRSRETRVRIGRGASMDVKLVGAERVSRVHCYLELRGRRLFIVDDASAEGTYVNEVRVLGPTPVRGADEIQVGYVRLSVVVDLEDDELNGPDAKEEELLDAISKNPKDVETRLVYADWLEENGHPKRAELLRLQCETIDENDEEQVKRMELKLEALSRQDEAWWRTLISRSPIDKCTLPVSEMNEEVRFKFQCPKRWSELEPTPRDTIRFCEVCMREVYFCSDLETVRLRARRKECVAFDSSLRRKRALTVYDETDEMILEMGEVGTG